MPERFNPYLEGLGHMNVPGLVALIHAAPPNAIETTELEWKVSWDFDTKPRCADMARHIIAMANRDPDRASRIFGGHAFIVLGVEPGRTGSVPVLDPADLYQRLSRFTGNEVGWHPAYVEGEEGHVALVLVVDPPRWGDPIHRLARTSQDATGRVLEAGTAYVRKPGMTIAADASDLARLEKRASVPAPHLKVALDWNLGVSGDYVGITVLNGTLGAPAVIREAGFTFPEPCEVSRLPGEEYAPGAPDQALAYAAFPVETTAHPIQSGERFDFRRSLGRLPDLWGADTEIYPYVYFDDWHWLVGEPSRLVGLLVAHGWIADPQAPPALDSMKLDYIWPESMSGLRGTFDLSSVYPGHAPS